MHMKLMIPGPIELEDDVLQWMGKPNHVHYGDQWLEVHNDTIALLQKAFATSGKVFIMPGSGSLGLDAAVHSTFAPGDRVAVGINGHFGHRLQEILTANGAEVIPVEAAANRPLDPAAFEQVLKDDLAVVGVVVVHLETSTAVLNPVREIAQVVREHDRLIMVDAVSSLAGTEYRMDDWGIDLSVSASQKGLGGAAGLSLVAVGPRAWEVIEQQAAHVRSWYLDLRRWQWYAENWKGWHPFPVTMPTAVVLGLRAALQSLFTDGLEARLQRYEMLATRLRSGLTALGMTLFVPESLMAPVLTAAYCPAGVASSEIVKALEAQHNIKITGGFGEYSERVIRVGHMGGAIDSADIDLLLDALGQVLSERKPAT
jgi:alanine-glyoxylate transaminase/serine-glyoxylate transaminase/serine-pyruvate transaminase